MARRNAYRPYRKPAPKGFNATALQFRRAYQAHTGRTMEQDGVTTYEAAGRAIVDAMGWEAAEAFVRGQSNDPALPD